MREVKIGRKYTALVDDADWLLVSQYNWQTARQRNATYYAVHCRRKGKRVRDKTETVIMHRLIMGAKPGEVIGHIDGNGLNNQRSNLRVCTHQESLRNQKKKTKSGYKGVHPVVGSKTGKWVALAWWEGKLRYIGQYTTAEDAARAYDKWAIEHHGAFAVLNFPESRGVA